MKTDDDFCTDVCPAVIGSGDPLGVLRQHEAAMQKGCEPVRSPVVDDENILECKLSP